MTRRLHPQSLGDRATGEQGARAEIEMTLGDGRQVATWAREDVVRLAPGVNLPLRPTITKTTRRSTGGGE